MRIKNYITYIYRRSFYIYINLDHMSKENQTPSITSPIYQDQQAKIASMQCTTSIVVAWCSQNKCNIEEIQNHINTLYFPILQNIVGGGNGNNAIKIEDTVFDDYIVCLEDGAKLKMLKRHLWSKYGMTVDDYKKKWGLGHNYPSVAPNYTKKRSNIAKEIKKGQGSNMRTNATT